MNIVLLLLSLTTFCTSQKPKDGAEYSSYVASSWPAGYSYETKDDKPIINKKNIEPPRRDEYEYSYEGGYGGIKDTDVIPKIIGRQGLGFERRVLGADGLRRPITPQALEHIGKRRLLKELKYEPL